jgi:hypothetical protein
MKRLMIPIVMLAAVLIAVSALAQTRELAGSWVLDVEKTGKTEGPPAIVTTLTDKEFIARVGPDSAPAMVFRLDGTETTLKNGHKTKAAWKGNKLEATLIGARPGDETLIFSREGEWLLVEGPASDGKTMKFYFKKAPAKL